MVAVVPVDQPDGTAEERGKAVKLAKRRCISASDVAYFSAFATPLCLSASCYPSLSLRAIVPTGKIVPSWKFQSIPILFVATFNGIIRWKLKSLADTIVVIIALFFQNSRTVWMGSPQAPKHSQARQTGCNFTRDLRQLYMQLTAPRPFFLNRFLSH